MTNQQTETWAEFYARHDRWLIQFKKKREVQAKKLEALKQRMAEIEQRPPIFETHVFYNKRDSLLSLVKGEK